MTAYGWDTGQNAPPQARPAEGGPARIVHWAGALVSFALIAGIVIWGYQLISRDVSGVPVVRAMEGPMRVLPPDPGGRPAEHQGLSVNEVAGVGTASGPVDQVTIAARPAGLSSEDVAHGVMTPAETAASLTPEDAVIPDDSPLAQIAEQGADPVISTLTGEATAEIAEGVEPPVVATVGALDRSLRPNPRPNLRAVQITRAAPPALPPAVVAPPRDEVAEISADSIAPGTRLVQIGAFDSPETARSEWVRLIPRFGPYLEDKSRVIQRAVAGGRVFYRLRVHGFADFDDAQRFCSALEAQAVDCIPLVTR